MSRGQLLELVRDFAYSLRASGIRPGDTVNIADTNTVRRQGSAFNLIMDFPIHSMLCLPGLHLLLRSANWTRQCTRTRQTGVTGWDSPSCITCLHQCLNQSRRMSCRWISWWHSWASRLRGRSQRP